MGTTFLAVINRKLEIHTRNISTVPFHLPQNQMQVL